MLQSRRHHLCRLPRQFRPCYPVSYLGHPNLTEVHGQGLCPGLYEQCSIDYDKHVPETQEFFQVIQDKLHWAVTGKTAAELIAERADCDKPNMGLLTWKNAPSGKILKSDVRVAKNYLGEEEIKHLERIVSMYLDYAENQAAKQIPMTMRDWRERLDAFLKFNEYEILENAGSRSHEAAKKLAEGEYTKFRVKQDGEFVSDFEREVEKVLNRSSKTEEGSCHSI